MSRTATGGCRRLAVRTLADEEPAYQVEISILEQPAGFGLELAPELQGE